MTEYVPALDQGATSARLIVYQLPDLVLIAPIRRALAQHDPVSGWAEHGLERAWRPPPRPGP